MSHTPSPFIVDIRPARRSVLLRSWKGVLFPLGLAWGFSAVGERFASMNAEIPFREHIAPGCGILAWLLVLRAAWVLGREVLLRRSRRYRLTATDITFESGILHRTSGTLPVRNIQQIVVDRTAGERALGMGTLLVSSAGSHRVDVAWVSVADADALAATIRQTLDEQRPMPGFLDDAPGKPPATPIVLGLVGGIGAGKSAVAAILGQLGCLVVDADRDARAAIDRPDIQGQLVRWWGPSILNADGKVNRKAVAAIVFDDPTQRTRLESVLHPVIKAFRGEVIDRARSQGMRGVVIDAPLLFEAESDKECDAVIFVDTPLERRIEHVQGRGWTAAELERRERAQMPLAEKRSRCQATVVNDGSLESLAQRVKAVFEDLAARHARGETLRPPGSVA